MGLDLRAGYGRGTVLAGATYVDGVCGQGRGAKRDCADEDCNLCEYNSDVGVEVS